MNVKEQELKAYEQAKIMLEKAVEIQEPLFQKLWEKVESNNTESKIWLETQKRFEDELKNFVKDIGDDFGAKKYKYKDGSKKYPFSIDNIVAIKNFISDKVFKENILGKLPKFDKKVLGKYPLVEKAYKMFIEAGYDIYDSPSTIIANTIRNEHPELNDNSIMEEFQILRASIKNSVEEKTGEKYDDNLMCRYANLRVNSSVGIREMMGIASYDYMTYGLSQGDSFDFTPYLNQVVAKIDSLKKELAEPPKSAGEIPKEIK